MRDNLAAQKISMPTLSKVMKILFDFFFSLFTRSDTGFPQGRGPGNCYLLKRGASAVHLHNVFFPFL